MFYLVVLVKFFQIERARAVIFVHEVGDVFA